MVALKIRRVGSSLGVILSREIANRLNLVEGDSLCLTEAPGGLRMTPYDPEIERQIASARRIMKKRRNALRNLAK